MGEASKHAVCSPSGASGWLECAGWRGDPFGNEYAREGTAAHELGQMCLTGDTDAAAHLGRVITVEGQDFTVDAEMAEHVQKYVDHVRDLRDGTGGQLLVEQRLAIDHITGEDGAAGTSDAVVITEDELIVADLKFGRGIEVDAEENPQLQLYALGALREFELVADFKRVRMVILQPRLGHVSEWACDVEQLRAFGERARQAAARALGQTPGDLGLNPGEKQCRWCANKATCPALISHVQTVIGADFEDIAAGEADMQWMPKGDVELSTCMAATGLIEDWIKAVRAETERRLLAGTEVPGFKLVLGKAGNRKWNSEAEAEQQLKAMRLKVEEMYDLSLISPTSAEKLAKAKVIGPRQWPKLQSLIGRADPKPSVAPVTDKRDAYVPPKVEDDFSTAEAEATDLA